jgi:3-hydroxy-9,10-secoandrosta-1,3,5(10)-triene-9,17-dione monooxygenase reductase component
MSVPEIDTAAFRRVLGQFATGVTVITIQHGDTIHGMTANSFTSVSMDPPLVLFCVAKSTRMSQLLDGTPGFAINMLSATQEHVSRQFAGSKKDEATRTVRLERGPVAPLIDGSLAALSCVTDAIHEGGDHLIVVGRVVALHEARMAGGKPPLVFFRSRYHDVIARPTPAVPSGETWTNDAILMYHDEWSVDAGAEVQQTDAFPWQP